MKFPSLALLALLLTGTGGSVMAAVPLYDDFSSGEIDRSKWNETGVVRLIERGRLRLARMTLGGTAADTGVLPDGVSETLSDPAVSKGLKATITVNGAYLDESCAANTTPSFVRGRLLGSFFNVRSGGPVAGDRTGDVLAQVRVGRRSNSTDAPGTLRVEGVLSICTSSDCNNSSLIGTVADLGTVSIGKSVRAQIDWDKRTRTFTFTRDALTPVNITYTQSHAIAPVLPLNNVSVRNEIQNCLSGARVKGGVDATFDNFGVAY